MPVSAVIKVEQLGSPSNEGRVSERLLAVVSQGTVREDPFTKTGSVLMNHLPSVSNPTPRPITTGWTTQSQLEWSDSPERHPVDILYRHRFAFGRDRIELFDTGYGDVYAPETQGSRWGNLDNNSGVLVYERTSPLSATGSVRQFRVQGQATVRDMDMSHSSYSKVSHLGEVSGETTVELFPFVLFAIPEPFSERNPVDTDVFIRVSNFSFPIVSGTISLYIDEVLRTPIEINEFFAGLGGFDITWHNNQEFEYDATVLVRLEFFDSDTPANKTVIAYPFYTVPDLAAPRAVNLSPADEATGVPVGGPIQFDLKDFENDVDLDTLILYVNNVKIIDGQNGSIVITELNTGGYTIQFTPVEPWLYGDLIPVSIFVRDTSEHQNELFFSYSFTTEESLPPRLLNLNPEPCMVGVPSDTTIQADVIDGGHGLEKDSIVLTVEEIERGNTVLLIPIVHRDE